MIQSYVKSCVFCKESLKTSDENGKWLPYNQDGSQHDCKKETKNLDISVEVLLKKLEIIGIKIDLQKLRNVNYPEELYDECVGVAGKSFCDFLFRK